MGIGGRNKIKIKGKKSLSFIGENQNVDGRTTCGEQKRRKSKRRLLRVNAYVNEEQRIEGQLEGKENARYNSNKKQNRT